VYFLIGRKPRPVVATGRMRAWAAEEAGVQPHTIDAVPIAARRGNGKRASLYTESVHTMGKAKRKVAGRSRLRHEADPSGIL
jgi:hypothetical protein